MDIGIIAIQRTFVDPVTALKADFFKPKRALGQLGEGAVRLSAPTEGRLGLAEGTESALSAQILFGIPCWATLGNERFGLAAIPESITELHLFVDADKGGQLTRPVMNNRKRLVLFDEVEKAWSGIFDLFLSMMGDGRLTEQGSGKEANFTQSIIVLTSNAEADAITKIDQQIEDPQEKVNAIKQHLRDSKVFRAEILGRFDRIYVFKPLSGMVNAKIAVMKMRSLAKEYGLELAFVSPQLVVEAMQKGNKLKDFGVRELDRVIGEMLGDAMYEARRNNIKKIKLRLDPDGVLQIDPEDAGA